MTRVIYTGAAYHPPPPAPKGQGRRMVRALERHLGRIQPNAVHLPGTNRDGLNPELDLDALPHNVVGVVGPRDFHHGRAATRARPGGVPGRARALRARSDRPGRGDREDGRLGLSRKPISSEWSTAGRPSPDSRAS